MAIAVFVQGYSIIWIGEVSRFVRGTRRPCAQAGHFFICSLCWCGRVVRVVAVPSGRQVDDCHGYREARPAWGSLDGQPWGVPPLLPANGAQPTLHPTEQLHKAALRSHTQPHPAARCRWGGWAPARRAAVPACQRATAAPSARRLLLTVLSHPSDCQAASPHPTWRVLLLLPPQRALPAVSASSSTRALDLQQVSMLHHPVSVKASHSQLPVECDRSSAKWQHRYSKGGGFSGVQWCAGRPPAAMQHGGRLWAERGHG